MFTALENEIVRILRANLSSPDIIPPPVPTDRILSGPLGSSPQQSEFPTVVFSATAFTVVPETECSPPGEVKVGVEETCAANGMGQLGLSQLPLEPLRAVEILGSPQESAVLLREHDD